MDYSQLIMDGALLLFGGVASTVVATKVSQSVTDEKLKAMKENIESNREEASEESTRLRSEILDSMGSCRGNHKDRLDALMDYIKRVDASKADRSEFNMVIDNMKRIESKLDVLILRNNG